MEDQAIARAIRLGQEQQVMVIRYCVKNSIEEVIALLHLPYPSLSTGLIILHSGHVHAANA